METPSCAICCESDDRVLIEIKDQAIQRLITSSKQRCDHKYKSFETATTLRVHESCKKTYIKPSAIDRCIKEKAKRLSDGRSAVRKANIFQFKSLCFFCEKNCNKYKQDIRMVSNSDTKENIIEVIKNRNLQDQGSKKLLAIINSVSDLVKEEARYHANCFSVFMKEQATGGTVGRPASQNSIDFVEFLIEFLEKNISECQFSLKAIKKIFTDEPEFNFPCSITIKKKLTDHFKNDVKFFTLKDDVIIIYNVKLSKDLIKNWYQQQVKNPEEERARIVEMAARICLEDIRSMRYTQEYEMPNLNGENLFKDVPKTLKNFLDIIIKSHKDKNADNVAKLDKKVATFSHCLITAARPRSFLSPILLGLSSLIHKKYGTKGLIDSLSNIGLVSSYKEVLRFESSIVDEPLNITLHDDAYLQFIYDNADHNICTIDGKNTWHVMGGIMVVTPTSSVLSNEKISRLNKIPSKELKIVSCRCESGCESSRCGCRKHGLRCTNLCSNCHGSEGCSNVEKHIIDDLSDSEETVQDESPQAANNDETEAPEESWDDFNESQNGEDENLNDLNNLMPSSKKRKIKEIN